MQPHDPTRLCARCEREPRWSKHPSCKLCRGCAGPAEVARKVRIRSPYLQRRPAWSKPGNVAQRERYARLTAAGVPYALRRVASKTGAATARALAGIPERLTRT